MNQNVDYEVLIDPEQRCGKRSTQRLFIATEGSNSEPKYFSDLGKLIKTSIKLIHVKGIRRLGLSDPEHVFERIKIALNDEEKYKPNDDYVVVVDKDKWSLDLIETLCKNYGVKIFVSNPCFEVWILFHLINKNQVNRLISSNSCDDFIDEIKQYFNHHNKDKPLRRWDYAQYPKAIDIAKQLDVKPNELVPENPGSRIYRLIEKLVTKD